MKLVSWNSKTHNLKAPRSSRRTSWRMPWAPTGRPGVARHADLVWSCNAETDHNLTILNLSSYCQVRPMQVSWVKDFRLFYDFSSWDANQGATRALETCTAAQGPHHMDSNQRFLPGNLRSSTTVCIVEVKLFPQRILPDFVKTDRKDICTMLLTSARQ